MYNPYLFSTSRAQCMYSRNRSTTGIPMAGTSIMAIFIDAVMAKDMCRCRCTTIEVGTMTSIQKQRWLIDQKAGFTWAF
jgi:hypothetical protein